MCVRLSTPSCEKRAGVLRTQTAYRELRLTKEVLLKKSSLPHVAPGHCATRVCFLGAVHGNVTGSMHLVELLQHDKVTRILIDVGQTVDKPRLDHQNRLPDGLTVADIDIVIITHAHLDHSGLLPLFYKLGFRGKVLVTDATGDLMEIMLPDSGKIQEADALRENMRAARKQAERALQAGTTAKTDSAQPAKEQKKRKGSRTQPRPASKQPQVQPLYTQDDAVKSLSLVQRLPFSERIEIAPGVQLRFIPASHILGAAMVHLELGWNGEKRTCLFAGNIGHKGMPLMRDIADTPPADYVFMESTYGDRVHKAADDLVDLATILNEALERASKPNKTSGYGVVVIPVFSVGRAQTMLDRIRRLKESGRLPKNLAVFLDSPMSIKVTEVHRREEHRQLLNAEMQALFASGKDPFRFPGLVEVAEFRKELLEAPSQPVIILCSPGMGNGGRALSQLDARLGSDNNTVLFVGYQGRGTVGGALLDIRNSLLAAAQEGGSKGKAPAKTLTIMGRKRRVNAKIEFMPHYSAHGDQQDIIRILRAMAAQREPKLVFLEHGDAGAVDALEERIVQSLNLKVKQPTLKEWYLFS